MTAPNPDITAVAAELERLVVQSCPLALEEHPTLPLPSVAELLGRGATAEKVLAFFRERHAFIHRQQVAPLYYGYEPASWARARRVLAEMRKKVPKGVLHALLQGGNRASKTVFCAKLVMESLTQKANRSAWCLHSTQQLSIEGQHPHLWKYFPPEWKPEETGKMKKGAVTSVTFNQKTGFTGDKFVLPNGSQALFKFYASDKTTLEGPEQDIIWADELLPEDWIETLEYRLVTRNGLLLVSFTPVEGYSPTVAHYLDGAVAVETMEAELLPQRGPDGTIIGYERVPLIMACREERKRVVYFPTQENFYSGYETLKVTLAQKDRDTIRMRAYGVATKAHGAKFTNWDDTLNVLPEAGTEHVLSRIGDLTLYHVLDPASGRNPAMIWGVCTPTGQKIIIREWPQPGDYIPGVGAESGVWAESGGSADGRKGPAQTSFKMAPVHYSREIARVERELAAHWRGPKGERINRVRPFARYMDSRAGNTESYTASRMVTLIQIFEELEDDVLDDGTREERSLIFDPAPGGQKDAAGDDWITIIQSALVDRADGTGPELMVASCCRNTIFALKTWTGLDGATGSCKDFVDVVKYFMLAHTSYIDLAGAAKISGGGHY